MFLEDDDMNVPTQIRIDSEIKKQAASLFRTLGLDMSTAINMFLRQCVLKGGIPFVIENPKYKKETIQAMEEAKRISSDKEKKGYSTMKELKKSLQEE